VSSATRLGTYALPAIWLSTQPFFRLQYVWYWAIATVLLQALISLSFLKRQLRVRLALLDTAVASVSSEGKVAEAT
jgi:hypothetical protein